MSDKEDDDSDCQIIEAEIPLIEVKSDGENEKDNKNDVPETKPSVEELRRVVGNLECIDYIGLNEKTSKARSEETLPENSVLRKSNENEERLSRISVDSDCQLIEPQIELIEINDLDNNNELAQTLARHNTSEDRLSRLSNDIESKSSSRRTSLNQEEKDENSSLHLNSNIFRITFCSEEKYIDLKDTIISSLKLSFEEKNLNVELSENAFFWEINGTDGNIKIGENTSLPENTLASENQTIHCKRSLDFSTETKSKKSKIGDDLCENRICFNCDKVGDHEFKNCTLPLNQTKITKNRRKFYLNVETHRHTLEERFGCITPGKLSKDLRHALGLANKRLPSFFYRMRVLGYPPGWLENAKEKYPDNALVSNSTGQDGKLSANHFYYNVQKIISFPGFNVYPKGEFFDEYEIHGVPPIDSNQSKSLFVYELGEANAKELYNRIKKLENSKTSETETETVKTSETETVKTSETETVENSKSNENLPSSS